ncbi:hypothetical protein CWN49_23790 [Klebsiella michiganensis]|uniref:Uncharacterized protein n=1 Tax=Klebsiella michiganensis TaxID=1134687 RepID=A0A2J5PHK6_9ENTR|nr:hypothetical protein CWN49_23790 [Klebsiella michiganensis]
MPPLAPQKQNNTCWKLSKDIRILVLPPSKPRMQLAQLFYPSRARLHQKKTHCNMQQRRELQEMRLWLPHQPPQSSATISSPLPTPRPVLPGQHLVNTSVFLKVSVMFWHFDITKTILAWLQKLLNMLARALFLTASENIYH